uniref:Putative secreted protein n=1 Tax=Anopheles triannulatus TaxID=58253 RepID=A0A2M4B3Z9_9DIPT
MLSLFTPLIACCEAASTAAVAAATIAVATAPGLFALPPSCSRPLEEPLFALDPLSGEAIRRDRGALSLGDSDLLRRDRSADPPRELSAEPLLSRRWCLRLRSGLCDRLWERS